MTWRASELSHTFKLVMIMYCHRHAELSLLSPPLSEGALNPFPTLTLQPLVTIGPVDALANRSFVSLLTSLTFNHKHKCHSELSSAAAATNREGREQEKLHILWVWQGSLLPWHPSSCRTPTRTPPRSSDLFSPVQIHHLFQRE